MAVAMTATNKCVFILLDLKVNFVWLAAAGLFPYYTGGITLCDIIV